MTGPLPIPAKASARAVCLDDVRKERARREYADLVLKTYHDLEHEEKSRRLDRAAMVYAVNREKL